MTISIDDINEQAEGAVLLDGLNDAIIGIVEEFGNGPRILYSKNKVLQILEDRDGMTKINPEFIRMKSNQLATTN